MEHVLSVSSNLSLLSPFLDIFRLGKCDPLEYIFNIVSHPKSGLLL